MQAHIDNNSLQTPNLFQSSSIYNDLMFRAYLSLPLISINNVLRADLKTLNNARHAWTVLRHLNSYKKALKSSLMNMFKMGFPTFESFMPTLIEKGYVRNVQHKTRGNLPVLVSRTAYMITPLGKQVASQLDDLLASQVAKLRK